MQKASVLNSCATPMLCFTLKVACAHRVGTKSTSPARWVHWKGDRVRPLRLLGCLLRDDVMFAYQWETRCMAGTAL